MGGDGGELPSRRDVVKTKATNSDSISLVNIAKYTTCHISGNVFQPPILVDYKHGNIFNKIDVIDYLLSLKNSTNIDNKFPHIKSLKKDFLLLNTKYININKDGYLVCPVTKSLANTSNAFIAVIDCGCLFAKRVLNEIDSNSKLLCPLCGNEVKDYIYINSNNRKRHLINSNNINESSGQESNEEQKQ